MYPMVKNKTAQIRTWHNIEVVGAILGIILILSFISVLSVPESSEASVLPTYYVSSYQGSDTFMGTSKEQPFKTVAGVTSILNSSQQDSRSARIVILGEYTNKIDLNGLGTVILEGGSENKVTGSAIGAGSGEPLIAIQNTNQVEIKGLNIFPADVTRPAVQMQARNESPTILRIKDSALRSSQGVVLFNNNQGLAAGSMKIDLDNNFFYVVTGKTAFISDSNSTGPQVKDTTVTLDVKNNVFQGYSLESLPVINVDDLSGFVTIEGNSFLSNGSLLIEGLTKFSTKVILENVLLEDNKIGQSLN